MASNMDETQPDILAENQRVLEDESVDRTDGAPLDQQENQRDRDTPDVPPKDRRTLKEYRYIDSAGLEARDVQEDIITFTQSISPGEEDVIEKVVRVSEVQNVTMTSLGSWAEEFNANCDACDSGSNTSESGSNTTTSGSNTTTCGSNTNTSGYSPNTTTVSSETMTSMTEEERVEEPKNDERRESTERQRENLQPCASIAEEKVSIDVSEQERREQEQEQEDTCKVREKEEDGVQEEEQGEGREEGKEREDNGDLIEEQDYERREKEGVRKEYEGREEQPDEEEPQIVENPFTSLPVSKNEDTNKETREQGTVMLPIRTEQEKDNQTKDQSTLTSLPDKKATLTSPPLSKNKSMNMATRAQGTVVSPIRTEDQPTLTSLPSLGTYKESTDTESSRIEGRNAEPVAGSSSTEPQYQKLAADVRKLIDQDCTVQQDKNRLEVEVKALKSQRYRDLSPRADARAEAIAEPTPPQTTAPRLQWIVPAVLYNDDRLCVLLQQLSRKIHADLVIMPSSSITFDHQHSVVLPVILSSRAGSDLHAAFRTANINVPAVVLIFHRLNPDMYQNPPATKDYLSDQQLLNSSRDMVDLVFWNENMYECAANTEGVQRLKELWHVE